jgi:hypothetical protein
MNSTKLEEAIGNLWASYIDNIDIDLPNMKISFALVFNLSNQYTIKHSLVFEGVSSFFFVNGEGDARLKLDRWENAELSEIYYFKKSRDHIFHKHDKNGTPQYVAHPNFHLEIWSTAFLIEAKNVIVDEIRYPAY